MGSALARAERSGGAGGAEPQEAVRALALREYGVDGALSELGSQQDRNFLVRAGDGVEVNGIGVNIPGLAKEE